MRRYEYEFLQELLTYKIENNPYKRAGNFKLADGYENGILTAKSILSNYYHTCCKEDE